MPAQSLAISRRVLVLPTVAGAIALACGGAGTNPNLVDISGRWRYFERYADVGHHAACLDSGTYHNMPSLNGFVGGYGPRGVGLWPGGGPRAAGVFQESWRVKPSARLVATGRLAKP